MSPWKAADFYKLAKLSSVQVCVLVRSQESPTFTERDRPKTKDSITINGGVAEVMKS